jgi:hypothetical protein
MSAQYDKTNPDGSSQDGCLPSFIVIGIGLAFAMLLWAAPAAADADCWDKSSVTLTGTCLASGQAEFTVANGGEAMTGETAWREYELGVLTNSGTLQLGAGESKVFMFGPVSGAIEFQVDQRPGHPGNSHPKLTLSCAPTAIKLSGLQASSQFALRLPELGNRGGCGRNNMVTVSCNVADAGVGFVSGDCDWGYWFSRVSTRRTFRIGQIVNAYGCEGENQELYAPIRISR